MDKRVKLHNFKLTATSWYVKIPNSGYDLDFLSNVDMKKKNCQGSSI